MSTIKDILTHEVAQRLGHKPNADELRSVINYIVDLGSDIKSLNDIGNALDDWQHDCTIECVQCGESFLVDAMRNTDDGEHVCSTDCLADYNNEQRWGKPERFGAFEYGVGAYGPFGK